MCSGLMYLVQTKTMTAKPEHLNKTEYIGQTKNNHFLLNTFRAVELLRLPERCVLPEMAVGGGDRCHGNVYFYLDNHLTMGE